MPDAPDAPTVQYLLPDLGEGMSEAEVLRWTVAVGDHVARDQIVVHVQTDKAEVELPVPAAGTITALGAAEGDMVPVGALLVELVPDEDVEAAPSPATSAPMAPQAVPATPAAARAGGAAGAAPQAAPPVRKLAKDLGVDLASVTGTGPGGRVTANDVRAAAEGASATPSPTTTPSPATAAGTRAPLRGIRRAMARNMAEAWAQVPHISLFDEIDARPLLSAHQAAREAGDGTLTLTAFFVRAAVLALRDVPSLNAAFDAAAEEVWLHDDVQLGIAAATDAGLVVPVLRDAHTLDLVAIGARVNELTAIARTGHLTPELLEGATFTITNFGTEGGRFATPIVRPPQVGILGFGAAKVRPVVEGDTVVAAPALPISLSADHRVVDGHDATTFLERVADLLARPGELGPRRQ
jgi:pyruvate/2-oxoglutarate dehydrogenase complex dihydrolipoamide acyltransferase (E2) component